MATKLEGFAPTDPFDIRAHTEFEEAWLIPKLTDRNAADRLIREHRYLLGIRRPTGRDVDILRAHSALEDWLIEHDSMLNLAHQGYL
jgi:hypothetical protein